MTVSSPRGTFSQAELTGERVITRFIILPRPCERGIHRGEQD